MQISDRTPERLVLVSLVFSLIYLISGGFTLDSLLLVLVFTLTVFSSTKVFILLQEIEAAQVVNLAELKFWLGLLAVILVSIATFSYSWLFGLFYGFLIAIYAISPYDRAWLAGDAKIIVDDNKVQYRRV